MLSIYNLILSLFRPFIRFYLLKRVKNKKEIPERINERFGQATIEKNGNHILWFHAASLGETMSLEGLIKKLSPDYQILLTTATVSSAKWVEKNLHKHVTHQFNPLDVKSYVKKFLNYWQPKVAFFTESEIWPNMIGETYKAGIPVISLNGRLSEKSFENWQKAPKTAQKIFQCFSLCLAQDEQYASFFQKLGAPYVKNVGNLKLAASPLTFDEQSYQNLQPQIKNRMVIYAASTHNDEELRLAQIYLSLKKTYPDLLLIISPRHPERRDNIIEQISSLKMGIAVRTKQEVIKDKTDIYLADTFGELGLFYQLSSLVFIGGSLIPHGGQNFIQATHFKCCILFGKHMFNFEKLKNEYLNLKAVTEVTNESALEEKLHQFLKDNNTVSEYAERAYEAAKTKNNILEYFLHEISPFLPQTHQDEKN